MSDSTDTGPAASGTGGTGAGADAAVIGETGAEVIGGDPEAERAGQATSGRDVRDDPDLDPVSGGDVSDTPAAQDGMRGAGTGADAGTGGEIGITRPGQS